MAAVTRLRIECCRTFGRGGRGSEAARFRLAGQRGVEDQDAKQTRSVLEELMPEATTQMQCHT